MQMCIYLGRKGTVQYCRKHADQACPAGQVRTCPCIPEDFWNVDAYKKKTIKGKSDHACVAEKFITEESSSVRQQDREIKKTPIRNISIFKEN